ncbi:MAG: sigma-70 family RNA polymerase sigma factor, partial [Candidatus Omnitrophica bacterium]|nr:sigma-70 family RNA polymerase sigma factor [Candidatus Omnitrophota bacterium]
MSNDLKSLRRYVEQRSESAFTELVREHMNLVYSAALRETGGDGGLAEDLSQAVFTELARKAPKLLGHPSLAGWLYTTVRHLAANLRRADRHRRRREEEAQTMNELLSEDSPDQAWDQIRPVLDDALHELNEADRAAVVLRFLEDRTLREVGLAR